MNGLIVLLIILLGSLIINQLIININNLSNIIEVILERESNENIKDKILKIIFPHH